jgi:hypothetical protein
MKPPARFRIVASANHDLFAQPNGLSLLEQPAIVRLGGRGGGGKGLKYRNASDVLGRLVPNFATYFVLKHPRLQP